MKLSPEAQELVSAVKRGYEPSEADRLRVLQALRHRLGDAVVLGEGVVRPALATQWLSSPLAKLVLCGAVALGGGALWLVWRTGPESDRVSSSASASFPVPVQVLPSVTEAPAGAASESVQERVEPPAVRPSVARPLPSRRASDRLSEEVAILARAQTELHGGRPESALKALDEHERKFGNGALWEERTAARIHALCALGRTAEAHDLLVQLARVAPNSPHTRRAYGACPRGKSP